MSRESGDQFQNDSISQMPISQMPISQTPDGQESNGKMPRHASREDRTKFAQARAGVYDVAILGMCLALIEAVKRALDAVPNVELVTFLFIMFTLFYGKKMLLVALAFVGLETAYWGPNSWVIMYLYMWPLLVLVVDLTRKHQNVWFYSILSAVYGLSFGFLCSLVYLFLGGPGTMLSWWIAGIPFDIIHCVSNFLVCLLLYKPVYGALVRVEAYLDSHVGQ